MKPTHTDKPNYLPSGVADTEGQLNRLLEEKTSSLDTNLRAYKSAAFIGLAISLGASGVLLPHQGDEAIAAESFTVSPTMAIPAGIGLSVSPDNNQSAPNQGLEITAGAVEPSSPVVITPVQASTYHHVQAGDNFWVLSQKYQVPADAIAQANDINIKATLIVGQSLRIPPTSNAIPKMQVGEITETNSSTSSVSKAQLQTTATPTTSLTDQGAANPELIFQSRQNDALQNLRGQREQLRETLGGWRVERNADTTAVNQTNLVASTPTSSSPSPVSGWLNNRTQFSGQVPVVAAPVQNSPAPELSAVPSRQSAAAVISGANSLNVANNTVANSTNLSASVPTTVQTTAPVSPVAPVVITTPSLTNAGNANWVTNSSRATTSNNWVASNPEPISAETSTVIAAMPINSALDNQEVASSPEVHQVRPGETLDAIARRYGISRQELARANSINNPNLLFVDQRLTIPATPARITSSVPSTISNTQKSGSTYDVSAVTPPTITTIAALPQTTSGGVFGSGSGSAANSSTSQLTQDELVTERLRSDIRRMREEHQHQRSNQPALISQNAAPTVSTESRSLFATNSRVSDNARGAERINPEFTEARSSTGGVSPSLPTSQPQIVAAASSPAGTFNPMLQLPVGQVVSPDLPPLAPADTYLPGSNVRFNGYTWPAEGVLTSGYGMRWGRMHRGIDIAAPIGTPIMAAAPGVVITAGWNDGGFGNLVEVQHPDGSVTLYAHNERIIVREGQQVAQGEQIAEMGSTGFSTGSHTHFEIHPTGRGAVDPIALMPRE